MKKIIALLLIGIVIATFGCVQQAPPAATGTDANAAAPAGTTVTAPSTAETGTTTTAPPTTIDTALTPANSALISDIESIAKEIANVNTADDENAITPITADDIATD